MLVSTVMAQWIQIPGLKKFVATMCSNISKIYQNIYFSVYSAWWLAGKRKNFEYFEIWDKSDHGITKPYFFEDHNGRVLIVNTERYCVMLQEFHSLSLQQFQGFNIETWFSRYVPYAIHQAIEVVQQLFPNKMNLRRRQINERLMSPDRSPMDYFSWDYLKSEVYENNLADTN